MDEQKKPQEELTEQKDFRKQGTANRVLVFRLLAIGFVLYTLWQIIQGYLTQAADAPSLTMVIVASVLLGGGCVFLAILTYRSWKLDQEAARMTQEELDEILALQAEDEAEETE